MNSKLDDTTRDAIDFINTLCEDGLIDWPIDFEPAAFSDAELAETFGHWFGGQRWSEAGDTFVQFGQDGTGSMFLLWYYPGLSTRPPVVFMGSEGATSLVANDIEDFIRQLASGKQFFDGDWLEPDEDEDRELDWQALAQAVDARYGLGDETPEQLSDKARREHPDFDQWVALKVE
ncbi:hypothetical protein ASF84_23985 [Pseudomonas sp. Leaf127]|uniref:hypothetical protein n=1 Tax=Pseudomonas sp. Leaf127 TaxID=1736267 RepID=UPI000703083D|nr:hypothetical protein [Pseudomonas sp. Leaf127]KQQ66379.1 hypothetical protein ASF84_23985 [Pseudomonas sp. Leaf127]